MRTAAVRGVQQHTDRGARQEKAKGEKCRDQFKQEIKVWRSLKPHNSSSYMATCGTGSKSKYRQPVSPKDREAKLKQVIFVNK